MSIKREPKFRHLTQEDRSQIDVLVREGHTPQRIAEKVGWFNSKTKVQKSKLQIKMQKF